jgi:RimJ/RimL family protein N-acetyltransferase
MQIETDRLVLRPPRLEDAEGLLDFVGDDAVMDPIGSEPGGIEVAIEHLERWAARWQQNGMGPFLLVERDGDRLLGRVGPLVWDSRIWRRSTLADAGDDAVVELGWAIGQEHRGRGLATEAALAVRQWVYDTRGVEHLISLINPENTQSIRVAEKLGARPTQVVQTSNEPATIWVHPR